MYTDSLNRNWADITDSAGNIRSINVESIEFEDMLISDYSLIGSISRQEVIRNIQGLCRGSGVKRPVFKRIGHVGTSSKVTDTTYYEAIGDTASTVMVYDKSGCRQHPATTALPVVLEKTVDQSPLEKPVKTPQKEAELLAGIDMFRKRLNRVSPYQQVQIIAAMVSYKLPNTLQPMLVLTGESGSGKSTTAVEITRIIDPNGMMAQIQPSSTKSLKRALAAGYVTTMHNASSIPTGEQDVLCVAVDEGSDSEDKMRENGVRFLMDTSGPIIMAMLEKRTLDRFDAISRAVFIDIHDRTGTFIERGTLESAFDTLLPELQALFRGLAVYCIKHWNSVDGQFNPQSHRCIEYVRIYTILAELIGNVVPFDQLVEDEKQERMHAKYDESILAQDLLEWFANYPGKWDGYAKELIHNAIIPSIRDDEARRLRIKAGEYGDLKRVNRITRDLKSLVEVLNHHGVDIAFDTNRTKKGHKITISKLPNTTP